MSWYRCVSILGLAILSVVSLSLTAHGQARRGGGRGEQGPGMMMGRMAGGPLMLLRSEQVQEELKLSEDQKAKLRDLAEQLRSRFQQRFAEMRDLSPEERRARMAEMREKLQQEGEAQAAEAFKQVAEILQPEQLKRLKQIQLQLEGPAALRRPEVAEAIGLTDAQKKELERIAEESREAIGKLWEEARERRSDRGQRADAGGELREKAQALREEAERQAMGVLKPEQKAKLAEMLGEPFELDRSRLFSGRGDGRGRPGGEGRLQRGGGR